MFWFYIFICLAACAQHKLWWSVLPYMANLCWWLSSFMQVCLRQGYFLWVCLRIRFWVYKSSLFAVAVCWCAWWKLKFSLFVALVHELLGLGVDYVAWMHRLVTISLIIMEYGYLIVTCSARSFAIGRHLGGLDYVQRCYILVLICECWILWWWLSMLRRKLVSMG